MASEKPLAVAWTKIALCQNRRLGLRTVVSCCRNQSNCFQAKHHPGLHLSPRPPQFCQGGARAAVTATDPYASAVMSAESADIVCAHWR
jgi:hypothetical protein